MKGLRVRAAAALVAFVAGLGLLPAPAGAQWFSELAGDLANRALQGALERINRPGELEIAVGRVSLVDDGLQVDGVTVADGAGVWFRAGTATLDWAWRAAFSGVLQISSIDIASVTIVRLPVSDTPEAPTGPIGVPLLPGMADWPRAPVDVRLDRLTLHRAALDAPVLGRAAAARIDVSASDVGPEQAFDLTLVTLDPRPARLAATWQADFDAEAARIGVDIEQPPGGPLLAVAGLPADLPLSLSVRGDGPLNAWDGRLSADAGRYGGLSATLDIRGDTEGSGIRFEAAVQPGAALPEAVRVVLGPAPGLRGRLRHQAGDDSGGAAVIVEDLSVDSAGARLDGAGRLDLDSLEVTGGAVATVPSLARLTTLAGLPLDGTGRADLTAGPGQRLTLTGQVSALSTPDPLLAAVLGDTAGLALSADWTEPTLVALSGRAETAGGVLAQVSGDLVPETAALAFAYDLALDRPGRVLRAAGLEADADSATLAGQLGGTAPALRLDGTLAAPGLRLEGRRLGDLTLTTVLDDLRAAPSGRVEGMLTGGVLPVTVNAQGQADPTGGVRVAELDVRAGANRLSGTAVLPAQGLPEADLTLAAPDLGGVLGPLGLPASGRGQGRLRLTPAAASLVLTFEDLQNEGVPPVNRLAVTARGPWAAIDTELTAELGGASSATLTAAAVLDASAPGQLAMRLTDLTGDHGPLRVALRQPALIRLAAGRQSVRDLDLDISGGRLRGAVALTRTALSADLAVTALPLALATLVMPTAIETGTLDAELRLVGGGPEAGAQFNLEARDVHVDALVRDFDLGGRIAGTWDGRRIEATAMLANPATAATVQVSGRAGLRPDPTAPLPRLRPQDAIDARARWQGDIEGLWALVPAPDHLLSGQADVDVVVDGTVARPRTAGRVAVTGGTYENLVTGTILRDLTVEASLDSDRRMPWTLSATDGGNGRIAGEGVVDFSSNPVTASRADVTIAQAVLVQRDDVTARASGRIVLEPEDGSARLSGRLTTGVVEARLIGGLPPSVVAIDVTRSDQTDATPPTPVGVDLPIVLDLGLDVPSRAFVRGRGADTEWRGTVRVSGPAAAPTVEARFEALRGVFDFLGKAFTLDRGTVEVRPGSEPRVDLRFERTDNGITGRVEIAGAAARPEITFSSVPALPESEVLPRLLFGTSQQSLGATDALQLAQALAALTDGRPGLTDRLRRGLGLDTLRLDTGEEGGAAPNVTVGRRVGNNVFIGGRQPTGGGSGSVLVEIEVLPQIKLETELGATGDSNAAILWEYKY